MIKKFPYNFLRLTIVLIFFSVTFSIFSQSDVYINVNWVNYSGENKMEIINSSNTVVLSIDHNYGNGSNTSYLNKNSNTVSLPNGTYTVRVYDNYGDDWNGTGSYGKIFVEGTEEFSFNGDFSNNASANTEITFDYSLTIDSLDDASFSYSKSGYCQSESDPTPTITGETGGTFSSTSGLALNSTTGQIDLSASTLGNYVVTYTTTAPDQNSATVNVSITDGDVATFAYTFSFATQNDTDISPTTTGQSGIFSSTSGLSINASTGLIDVSDSTPGFYTVSYTTNGSCPKVYTYTVRIVASTYYNASKKYIEYIPGTMPVIISAPHGGTLTGSELATRGCGTGEMDDNTDVLIREIQKKCYDEFGVYPYIIINNLRRNKLDPNRNKSIATCGNSSAEPYFDAYHGFIDQASADVTSKFGKGLYIDLHGQSHSIPRIEAGYNLSSSSFDEDLNNTATNASELSKVTIKNLISNNIQNLTFEDLIRGAESFGGLMQTTGGTEYAALGHAGCSRGVGYRTVPSHIKTGSDQGSCDDTNPGNNSYFAGDYYSNIRHGSGNIGTANSVVGGGGSVNGGGGTIDGIMTEVNRRVRDLGSAYTSVYGRSDSRSATIPYFSRDYAKVIENFIELHYNDFSKFTYDSSSYSTFGIDPTPTISGISGGTFSSTSGLSINSSTGQIDVSASSTGTYTVAYVALNVGDYYKKEVSITINNDPVTNSFTANSGNWATISNWSLGRLPMATDNISIPSGKTANLNMENITVSNVSVAGTLNISSGKSITITGNLTTTGAINVNSNATQSGSLIVQGNSTGNITYNRYIKDNSNWHLISSPVENQDIDAFASANPLAVGSGNNRGLGTYNNVTPGWEYYQNGTTTSGNFVSGMGHSIRLSTADNTTFTGSVNTNNVSKNVTIGSNGWNLIGNPYPNFINVNDLADNVNNILDVNFSILQSGFKAIYFWDTVSKSYKPINNASDEKYLAPGQGYFVKVNSNGNVVINENMQSHQTGDYFLRGNSDRFEIKLKVNNGASEKSTDIKYITGTTIGLDEGYDAGLFNANSSSFSLYTHLVIGDDDTKYALQALPDNNFNTMVVPVGVNAKKDSEITFTADFKNIPNGIKVYLEDKEENVFVRIDENNSAYSITVVEDIEDGKRFYLHTTSETLTSESFINKTAIKIYKTEKNSVKVIGINTLKATLKVISILGKVVFNQNLLEQQVQEIKLPNLKSGVYFIEVKSDSKKIRKKIILE